MTAFGSRPDVFRRAKAAKPTPAGGAPAWATAALIGLSLSASLLAAASFSPMDALHPRVSLVVARPVASAKTPLWLRARAFQTAPYCPSAKAWASGQPLPPR